MVTTRRTGGAAGLTSMVASSRPLRPLSSRGAPHRDKSGEEVKKSPEEIKKMLHDQSEVVDAYMKGQAESNKQKRRSKRVCQPRCIKGEMCDYELEGLRWLVGLHDNGLNGILADAMGLRTRLQTISLLGYLHESRKISGPHLIVVQRSTIENWMKEFKDFCPGLEVEKFLADKKDLKSLKESLMKTKINVCVTTSDMAKDEQTFLRSKFSWCYIIIDEAHMIKNENCKLSKIMRSYESNYRLLITGTPIQNNLHELWALLNFLLPALFTSAEAFDECFRISGCSRISGCDSDCHYDSEDDSEDDSAETSDQQKVVQEAFQLLHKVISPFLLRRLKCDVEEGFLKTETILKVGMSEKQKKSYRSALLAEGIKGNRIMQMRKCCNHPYLFEGGEPDPDYTPGATDEHLIEDSGKMVLLDKLLPKLQKRGSRVLIYTQMINLLDILEEFVNYRNYPCCRIDGETSRKDRDASIEAFNNPQSDKFVFLLSTTAGGAGIDLSTADVVILYDSDWNPLSDLQAQDRAHRPGQNKEVQVFRFCTEHTIEEYMLETVYKKLALDALVLHKAINKDDLQTMSFLGDVKVFNSEDNTITDKDIEDIIATREIIAKRKVTAEPNAKMKKFTKGVIKFNWNKHNAKFLGDEKNMIPRKRGRAVLSSNSEGEMSKRRR